MTNTPPTVGLLCLRDLDAPYAWSTWRGPAVLATQGLAPGELLPPVLAPPSALVLVVDADDPAAACMHRGWLAQADALVLVLDASTRVLTDADAPDLAELLELELADTRAALGNVVAALAWDGRDPHVVRQALALAREHARPPRPEPTPRPYPAVAPGPWLAWAAWSGFSTASTLDRDTALTQLAQGLCLPGGRPTLVSSTGEILDLQTGARSVCPVASPLAVAITADGARRLTRIPGRHDSGWRLELPDSTAHEFPGPWGRPIQCDPWDRVAFVGHRCRFHWLVRARDGFAAWAPSEHDWPCGHGKKLWGYEDNDPLWIHLAPDASACLSAYGHDTLLTAGLPLRWRDVGDLALGVRFAAPLRVLIHAHDPGSMPGDPLEAADEDARHDHAVVTLGPDAAHRYVVSLAKQTWRILGDVAAPLGGPEPAWQIFDADHTPVRRSTGHLLAGWHEHVVVLEHDALWREHLVTGAREPLCPAERTITAAIAVAGTPNAVLFDLSSAPPMVRLV